MRRRLPWLLFGLWGVIGVVAAILSLDQSDAWAALGLPALSVLAGVGAVLASRRPGNPVGWLLLSVALVIATSDLATAIADGYADEPSLPLSASLLVWLDNVALHVWLATIGIAVPLLFPDGRLPSPRWRWLALAGAAVLVAAVLGLGFGGERLDLREDATVPNPLSLGGGVGAALETVGGVAAGGGLELVMLGALASIAVRLRRAEGAERQQLKWFVSAIALLLLGLLSATLGTLTGHDSFAFAGWMVLLFSIIVALPLAIGVAILRYHLYDIDVVINRALVYGGLTITLGGAYLGLVLVAGLAVGDSGLSVAASTLAVAALFRPARARVQALVDRRFYRRRYDAAYTLEAFGARLRDEIDLDALGVHLRTAARDTVQPAHVSLWLRGQP